MNIIRIAAVSWLAVAAYLSGAAVAQAPTSDKSLSAAGIMQKTLGVYAASKTYEGQWTYSTEQIDAKSKQSQKMLIEIKSKSPNRLFFHLALPPGQKQLPEGQALPELHVYVDGKTAWFENSSEKTYYKVSLPQKATISPLMFMPLIPAASAVQRKDDIVAEGKSILVLSAATTRGGVGRMEIESGSYHIRRVVTEVPFALGTSTSAITMDHEVFDGDIPESAFSFKPTKGAKEVSAPPDATAMFGPPDPVK